MAETKYDREGLQNAIAEIKKSERYLLSAQGYTMNKPSRLSSGDIQKLNEAMNSMRNIAPSVASGVNEYNNAITKRDNAERKNKELVQRLAVTEFNLSDPVQYPKGKKGKKGNSGTNEIDTGVVYNPKTGKFEIKNKDGKKKDNSGFSFKISDPNKGKPKIEYETVYNPKTNKFENVKIEQENIENKDKKKTSTADELRRFREFEKKGTEKVEVKEEATTNYTPEYNYQAPAQQVQTPQYNNVDYGYSAPTSEPQKVETPKDTPADLKPDDTGRKDPEQVENPEDTPADLKPDDTGRKDPEQVENPEDTPADLKPDDTETKDPEQVENPEDKPADLKPDDTETKDPEQVENPEDKPADLKPDDTTTTPEETENPEDKPADLKPDDTTTTPEETENPENKPADLKPDDTTTTPEETENPEDKPADLKPDDTTTTPEETEKTEDTSANLKPDDAETKSPEQNPNEEDEGIRYKEKISSNTQSSGGITGGNATTGKVEKSEEE